MFAFLLNTAFNIPGSHNPFDDFSTIGVPSSNTQPGSGTVNSPDPTQIQQAKALSTACGGGIVAGAVGGAVVGTIVPGLGTLIGAGLGALSGGILGCVIAPLYPASTTQFVNSIGGAVPALGAVGDFLSAFGTMMQYVTAFIHFVVDMALFGLLIWQFDPTIGLFLAPIAVISNFWLGYVLINMVRGRGG